MGQIDDWTSQRIVNVSRIVWGKLGVTEQMAPQEFVGDVLRAVFAKFVRIFPGFAGVMSGLDEADSVLMDWGLGSFSAAVLKPGMPKTQPETALVGVKFDLEEYKYANPTAAGKSREEGLVDEAWEWLGQVAGIRAIMGAAVWDRPVFARSGPRRSARRALGVSERTNPLYAIYANDLSSWQWSRSNALRGTEF